MIKDATKSAYNFCMFKYSELILRMNNGAPKKTGRCLVHDSDMSIGAVGGDSHAVLVMDRGE